MATTDSTNHDLPRDSVMNFVSTVKKVCDGLATVLALNYQHEGERLEENDMDPGTTLSLLEMESLMTLARASTDLLEREAAHMESWAQTYHSDAGALEAYAAALRRLKHRGLSVPTP